MQHEDDERARKESTAPEKEENEQLDSLILLLYPAATPTVQQQSQTQGVPAAALTHAEEPWQKLKAKPMAAYAYLYCTPS